MFFGGGFQKGFFFHGLESFLWLLTLSSSHLFFRGLKSFRWRGVNSEEAEKSREACLNVIWTEGLRGHMDIVAELNESSAFKEEQVPAVSALNAVDPLSGPADSSALSSLDSQNNGPASVIVESQGVPSDQASFVLKTSEELTTALASPQEAVVEVVQSRNQSPIIEEEEIMATSSSAVQAPGAVLDLSLIHI